MSNLILLAGVPGSGKSSFAESFFPRHSIVSSDDIRLRLFITLDIANQREQAADNNRLVFTVFHDTIASKLDKDKDVVADATFLTRKSREKVSAIAERFNALIHLILFKNVLQADMRNSRRDADKFVPESAMKRMMDNYYNTLAELPQETYASVTKIESYA